MKDTLGHGSNAHSSGDAAHASDADAARVLASWSAKSSPVPIHPSMSEDTSLELSRIERKAHEHVQMKAASQQLGEAWVGLR
jgi:hypothetical protein